MNIFPAVAGNQRGNNYEEEGEEPDDGFHSNSIIIISSPYFECLRHAKLCQLQSYMRYYGCCVRGANGINVDGVNRWQKVVYLSYSAGALRSIDERTNASARIANSRK